MATFAWAFHNVQLGYVQLTQLSYNTFLSQLIPLSISQMRSWESTQGRVWPQGCIGAADLDRPTAGLPDLHLSGILLGGRERSQGVEEYRSPKAMAPSSSSGTMTLCELDTCPAETPAQELVVVCTGYKQESQKDLMCRFTNGATSPAHFDFETQRLTCQLPQVSREPGRWRQYVLLLTGD